MDYLSDLGFNIIQVEFILHEAKDFIFRNLRNKNLYVSYRDGYIIYREKNENEEELEYIASDFQRAMDFDFYEIVGVEGE